MMNLTEAKRVYDECMRQYNDTGIRELRVTPADYLLLKRAFSPDPKTEDHHFELPGYAQFGIPVVVDLNAPPLRVTLERLPVSTSGGG